MNLQNIMQMMHGNAAPFLLGLAFGHIPFLIKIFVTLPPIKIWIKSNPKTAEDIVSALKSDVEEVIAEQPAAVPPAGEAPKQ